LINARFNDRKTTTLTARWDDIVARGESRGTCAKFLEEAIARMSGDGRGHRFSHRAAVRFPAYGTIHLI
jgi:hypothetical protein